MKRYIFLLSGIGLIMGLFLGRLMPIARAADLIGNAQMPNLAQYVNPFIGTTDSNSPDPVPQGGGGSDFPGAVAPFGMV